MQIRNSYLLASSTLVFTAVVGMSKLSAPESFIVGLQVYTFLRFVNNIGYTISFFEFLCFYSVFDTLLMPVVGYRIFNHQNHLSAVWGFVMRVPEDVYYSFLIPSNLALLIGTSVLSRRNQKAYLVNILDRIKANPPKGTTGLALTVFGFVASIFQNLAPAGLSFIFYLLGMLKFVGPLYIYYSNYKYRKIALWASIFLFFVQAIVAGLFGEFVMYVLLIFIVVALEFKPKFFKKLMLMVTALFLVMVLQTVKSSYRQITWAGKSVQGLSTATSSKTEIFGSLFLFKMLDPGTIFEERTMFRIYTRMNQGFLISRAMNYVPRVEPFAGGSTIARSLAAIVVPRFLWPDKPESGGRENLSRFLGLKKRLKYSMNIGPYGEAYGNFGPVYGVVFVFFYGLFLAMLLNAVLKKAPRLPTLMLWLPLLFFYTLTVETDILTTLNSFVKGAVFVALVYYFSKKFFNVSL